MEKQAKTIICPWWLCFLFDNFTRKWYQDPIKIMTPFIKSGFKILDVGPGRGYYTFPFASLVQPEGFVYALDIQKKMLDILKEIADKKGYSNIIPHFYDGKNICIQEQFDFVNLFWMCHEIRNKDTFLNELKGVCKTGSKILLVEPYVHVSKKMYKKSIQMFLDNGFRTVNTVKINFSRAVLLEI
jgi:ubiquinone/menaquinone biosynthesis C-methylase UbiE